MTAHSQPLKARLYYKKHVEQITNRSIQTLRRWWERNLFPKPTLINSRLAWQSEAINQWINQNVQGVQNEKENQSSM